MKREVENEKVKWKADIFSKSEKASGFDVDVYTCNIVFLCI